MTWISTTCDAIAATPLRVLLRERLSSSRDENKTWVGARRGEINSRVFLETLSRAEARNAYGSCVRDAEGYQDSGPLIKAPGIEASLVRCDEICPVASENPIGTVCRLIAAARSADREKGSQLTFLVQRFRGGEPADL
jgi:hypothetical protein